MAPYQVEDEYDDREAHPIDGQAAEGILRAPVSFMVWLRSSHRTNGGDTASVSMPRAIRTRPLSTRPGSGAVW